MAQGHPSSLLHALVQEALAVFIDHPEGGQDEILTALVDDRGIAPEQAWQLWQFVPPAACHVALGHTGAHFSTHYRAITDIDHPERADRRAWIDEPIYRATTELVGHMLANGLGEERAASVLRHSAELGPFMELVDQGAEMDTIRFSEQYLIDYEVLRHLSDKERS
jgi:hypothetical protein